MIDIKRFLKYLGVDFADQIKIPKPPKYRKRVVKVSHLLDLFREIDEKIHNTLLHSRIRAALLLSATSGLRPLELYKLNLRYVDLEERMIKISAEMSKTNLERVIYFNKESEKTLEEYLSLDPNPSFTFSRLRDGFERLDNDLRMNHMRKFFSQQSDRLGMPTAIKKLLMGHELEQDIDLMHYDFQDDEDLKKIYDRYWREFRILE
jgi:integrase/recombinase XerD